MENLNWKKTLLLSLPIVFAVSLAVTLAACMAQAGKDPNDSALDGVETTDPSVQVMLPVSSQGLSFRSLGDGSCELIGLGSCTDSEIVIPEESPDGDLVVAIGDSAFIGVRGITGVKLPQNVTRIGNYAFFHMEMPDETGELHRLPGQMTAPCGYAWSDGVEPVLIDLMNGLTVCSPNGGGGDLLTNPRAFRN